MCLADSQETRVLLTIVEEVLGKPGEEVRSIQWDKVTARVNAGLRKLDLPPRNKRQCKDRYLMHMEDVQHSKGPVTKRGLWEAGELRKLHQLVKEHGKRWTLISRCIPGRTPRQVKFKYYNDQKAQRRKGYKSPGDLEASVSETSGRRRERERESSVTTWTVAEGDSEREGERESEASDSEEERERDIVAEREQARKARAARALRRERDRDGGGRRERESLVKEEVGSKRGREAGGETLKLSQPKRRRTQPHSGGVSYSRQSISLSPAQPLLDSAEDHRLKQERARIVAAAMERERERRLEREIARDKVLSTRVPRAAKKTSRQLQRERERQREMEETETESEYESEESESERPPSLKHTPRVSVKATAKRARQTETPKKREERERDVYNMASYSSAYTSSALAKGPAAVKASYARGQAYSPSLPRVSSYTGIPETDSLPPLERSLSWEEEREREKEASMERERARYPDNAFLRQVVCPTSFESTVAAPPSSKVTLGMYERRGVMQTPYEVEKRFSCAATVRHARRLIKSVRHARRLIKSVRAQPSKARLMHVVHTVGY
ncbi:hypothetical protein KIPB_004919 [Kipferlia bialata]|uniref:Uncharacterized protein n=1 Tax=Kipferlia bialata TaxID=797122 RepID=A0A9K3CUJ8_9EUKA|nr:hypothetical protein KIPB_004919 [Kipferlia bialata]|eukprot:g4919.t1